GPMYPAAWERVLLTCPAANGAPLVRAVGAADALAQGVPWARPGSRPELVADGFVVPTQSALDGATVTDAPYSGTSRSTAAASAAAGAVWGVNGSWSADAVADALYQTGVSIGATAAFCACASGPPCACPVSRRISICGALGAAASGCRSVPAADPTW